MFRNTENNTDDDGDVLGHEEDLQNIINNMNVIMNVVKVLSHIHIILNRRRNEHKICA